MENSIWKKIANGIVFIYGLISLIVFVCTLIKNKSLSWNSLNSLIALVGGLIVYFYNNSNIFFIYWHKFLSAISKETVNWEMTYISYTDYDTVQEINRNLKKFLRKNGKIHETRRSDSTEYKLTTKNGYESTLLFQFDNSETTQVSVQMNSQSSSKEVNKQWDFFTELVDSIFKGKNQINSNEVTSFENQPYYYVNIKLAKSPFYKLLIRSYEKPTSLNFTLKFKDGGLNVTNTNNELNATSENRNEISGLLSKYITLSKVT